MVDVAESKEDRFKRLAAQRVPQALKRISLIAKLANRSSYAYTEEQVQKIVIALREEVTRLEAAFAPKSGGSKPQFQL